MPKSKRPLRRYVLRAIACTAGLLLVAYLFLLLRFVTAYPTPMVNYLEELNRPKLAMPAADRGWPIYRKALLALGERDYSKEQQELLTQIFEARPLSEHCEKVGPWLTQHAQVIELTRQGATRP